MKKEEEIKEKPKEVTLKDAILRLAEANEKNEEKKKEKSFKIPFFSRLSKGNLKRGYVTVCYINDNKAIDFIKVPVSEGTTMIRDTPYLAMADHMLTYKGKPFIIQPAWNIQPFCPSKDLDDAEKERKLNIGYRLLFNKMKSDILSAKKKISWLLIIGGLVVAGGLIWFLMKNPQGFKLV